MLDRRARRDELAYVFVGRDESEMGLTFAELRQRALWLAAAISEAQKPGCSLVIGLPSGVGYVEAFFACLYAGITPVAGHVTGFVRFTATAEGLVRTAMAVGADGVIAGANIVRWGREAAPELTWVNSEASGPPPPDLELDANEPPEVAYVQTTSGSTGAQRGVALSGASLIANLIVQCRLFPITPGTVMVSWLPMSHDMGFVGPLLQPLHTGAQTIFLTPFHFVMDPGCWLRAITRYRASVSGCPNFGYELVLRRLSFQERRALDLSSWECAINGAEPVRPDTLTRFARALGPAGFDANAFIAAYGLAEATSAVTASSRGRFPTIRDFDRNKLGQGRARLVGDGQEGRRLVGHGLAAEGHEALIVEGSTGEPLAEGRVGEIWVAGGSASQGYVAAEEENALVFGARLADGGGPYVRTGDEGFMFDGELYVSGRIKDFILVRGANHAPQDIEGTVRRAHSLFADSMCVAAPLVREPHEGVLVAVEAAEWMDEHALDRAMEHVRGAVRDVHGVTVTDLAVLPAGSIPVTGSGKVRRRETASRYMAGGFSESALRIDSLAAE